MALNFPSSPSSGDVYSLAEAVYEYTGTKWKIQGTNYNHSGALLASASAAITVDLIVGNYFNISTDESTTIAFTNPPSVNFTQCFYLKITSTGSNTITWPSSVEWETSVPSPPGNGETDVYEFCTSDAGTTYYAKLLQGNIG